MKPPRLIIEEVEAQALLNAKLIALNIQYQLDCTKIYIEAQTILVSKLDIELNSYVETVDERLTDLTNRLSSISFPRVSNAAWSLQLNLWKESSLSTFNTSIQSAILKSHLTSSIEAAAHFKRNRSVDLLTEEVESLPKEETVAALVQHEVSQQLKKMRYVSPQPTSSKNSIAFKSSPSPHLEPPKPLPHPPSYTPTLLARPNYPLKPLLNLSSATPKPKHPSKPLHFKHSPLFTPPTSPSYSHPSSSPPLSATPKIPPTPTPKFSHKAYLNPPIETLKSPNSNPVHPKRSLSKTPRKPLKPTSITSPKNYRWRRNQA